jgi:hypothetical protein
MFARLDSITPRMRPATRRRRGQARGATWRHQASAQTDTASARVRAAGGPSDLAYYSCECGFQFLAPVSTTVACPHCGARQAW